MLPPQDGEKCVCGDIILFVRLQGCGSDIKKKTLTRQINSRTHGASKVDLLCSQD